MWRSDLAARFGLSVKIVYPQATGQDQKKTRSGIGPKRALSERNFGLLFFKAEPDGNERQKDVGREGNED
jgi:hypothetical protein